MNSLWTFELRQDALDKFQFIVVTPIGLPKVNVTDIRPIWVLYPNFIFNTLYRIAGNRDDIVKEMSNLGYDESELAEVIAVIDNNSLTKDNFESLTNDDEYLVYDVELAGYDQWRNELLESQKAAGDSQKLTLFELLKAINPHIMEEKKIVPRVPTSTASNKTVKTTPSPKGKVGRKGTDLQEKIDKLPDDKIINVSKITATGTGTTTAVRPKKSSLFMAPNLPFISNNLEAMLLAIDLVGGEEEHSEDVEAANEFAWKDKTSPKPTPTKPTPKTTTTTTTITKNLIPPSKTVVPEAVQPIKNNLIPPSTGKRPTALVSGLAVPENSEI